VEGVARLDDLAVGDQDPRPARKLVRDRLDSLAVLVDLVGEDRELRPAVGVLDAHGPADLDELGRALRVPRLEDLDDARKAVRDVGSLRRPPVWKVRIVSCVPGSPIDCAAMIPTASPTSHIPPVAQEDAVARPGTRRTRCGI
jgi:hypothetical protein